MKTVTNVNSYVAWAEFQGSRSAYAQGIAESEEEFRQMCEEKGIDLTDCIVELNKKNVRNEIGQLYDKYVAMY